MNRFTTYTRLLALGSCIAGTAMGAGPASMQAQNGEPPQTFYACLVPEVGAIYLIRIAGLPDECLSGTHVEIDWTEGGHATLLDGSVTPAKLAPDAVTSAAIDDGGIMSVDIGADQVGSVHIEDDGIQARHIAQGAVREENIFAAAVGPNQIALNAVGQSEIAPNSVRASELEVFYLLTESAETIGPESTETLTVQCPGVREALSGGFNTNFANVTAFRSYPSGEQSWTFGLRNPTLASAPVTLWVVCADIDLPG